MKINRISWTNYKSLADGEIKADGADVLISGRNGAGKSSIASILPFVLTGEGATKIKCYENGLLPADDGLVHAAEIEFDNVTLRREYFWTKQGNRQKCYIDGESVATKTFDAKVEALTGGGGNLVCNPFAFCELKRDEQRALLIRLFAKNIDTSQFTEAENILAGASPEMFLSNAKRRLDRLKKDSDAVTPIIDELTARNDGIPQNLDKAIADGEKELQTLYAEQSKLFIKPDDNFAEQIDTLRSELAKLRVIPKDNSDEQIFNQRRSRAALQTTLGMLTRRLKNLRDECQNLRAEYKRIAATKPGICPTCGQPIPVAQFKAKRDKQLADITRRGQSVAEDIADTEKNLTNLNSQFADIDNRIAELERAKKIYADTYAERREQIAKLEDKIAKLNRQRDIEQNEFVEKRKASVDEIAAKIRAVVERNNELKRAADTRKRIEQLIADKRGLNEEIAALEYQVTVVKDFLHKKIELVENQINSQFFAVKFKLFDVLITTGEIKPTCEAMLDGVPYSALSKGERLCAALDIFATLQRVYGVEMPVFIDDEESYSTNSFIDLRNQKFLFRVTENDLTIEIFEKSAAA